MDRDAVEVMSEDKILASLLEDKYQREVPATPPTRANTTIRPLSKISGAFGAAALRYTRMGGLGWRKVLVLYFWHKHLKKASFNLWLPGKAMMSVRNKAPSAVSQDTKATARIQQVACLLYYFLLAAFLFASGAILYSSPLAFSYAQFDGMSLSYGSYLIWTNRKCFI